MYKILLALSIFIITFNVSANDYKKFYYITQNKIITQSADIVEFFSFYCPHCYNFYHIYDKMIKDQLPKNINIAEYHVSFLGKSMGKNLTKAWSVAKILGIQEKIKPIIFNNINNINNLDDVKKIFNSFGISNKIYTDTFNSILAKLFFIQQEKIFFKSHINSVPAFLIKGKYIINIDAIDHSSVNNFVNEYVKIVKFLLAKKD